MIKFGQNFQRKIIFLSALLAMQVSTVVAQNSIKLNVDATGAARNVLRVKETMAVKAGELTLFYPKWIPGEHSPTGTINDMVNLFIKANGKPIAWRRDDVEMFEFHLTIPAGVKEIEIAFDDVSQPATTASAQLARIKWNRLLLYPEGAKGGDVQVTGSMKMPEGWKYAAALAVEKETKNSVDFKQVSLEKFVDSPAVIGKFFKRVPLGDSNGAAHEIDIFADNAAALEYKPETLEGWKNLIRQENLLFGARHYNNYKFLLTLSDSGGDEGLEHHESSEDGTGEKALSNELELIDLGGLLAHEFTHSWNGKYRRPTGLSTGDFETPMKGDLLWVYEGLTEYLGDVMPARSGLWTAAVFRDVMAEVAANMDSQTGRRWRPIVDTASAVQLTYAGPRAWRNERRGADYYYEGELIWLEADVLIRQKSGGKLSLDDFLRKFHGGQNSAPVVKPYDFEEIIKTLNEVAPDDWGAFFNDRIYTVQNNAPLGGITNGGWKLIYNETPNVQVQVNEHGAGYTSFAYSIGILVNEAGLILDINPDLSAAKSGLAPAMKITKVNGENFSVENLHKAVAATKNNASPIEIVAEYGGFSETYKLNYQGGEKYPHLERDAAKTDFLSEIIKPLSETQGFIPKGFIPSNEAQSFIFSGGSRGKTKRPFAPPNKFADVTSVVLNQTEVTATCSKNSNVCSDKNQSIEISTEATDPEGDVLIYDYKVSAGKIIGQGSKVIWDLSGEKPGTYTINVGVDDGCGVCGKTITKEIKVVECPDCQVS